MILANLIDRSVRVGRRTVVKGVAALALTVSIGAGTSHAGELVNAQADGVAMDGFDVVAYHTAGAPAKGIASRSVEYKGKTWLFSSAENASKFSADPERYAPRYNGWCSYAVSEGYGAEVDFVNGWAVLDGKLYLNWDEETRDALCRPPGRVGRYVHAHRRGRRYRPSAAVELSSSLRWLGMRTVVCVCGSPPIGQDRATSDNRGVIKR
jgi:YHS domain-containing protein